MDKAIIARAAEILTRYRLECVAVRPFSRDRHPGGEIEVYAIRAALAPGLIAPGFCPFVSCDIGCIAPVMYRFPDFRQTINLREGHG